MSTLQLLLDLFGGRQEQPNVDAGERGGCGDGDEKGGPASTIGSPPGEEIRAGGGEGSLAGEETDWVGGVAGIFSEHALTRQARVKAAAVGLRKLPKTLVVRWNGRLQTTAGRAYYDGATIELNPKLRVLPDALGEVERTLLHELAHLVAHARAKGRRIAAHGPEWQDACADLGIPGEGRCHSLPLAARRAVRKRFAYQCPACGGVVQRVKKFARYSACYACCRRHNRGRYHDRFRFIEISVEEAERVVAVRENGGPVG